MPTPYDYAQIWAQQGIPFEERQRRFDELNASYGFPPGTFEQFAPQQQAAPGLPSSTALASMDPMARAQQFGGMAQVQPPPSPPTPEEMAAMAPPDPRLQRPQVSDLEKQLDSESRRFAGNLDAAQGAQNRAFGLQAQAVRQSVDASKQTAQVEQQHFADVSQKIREMAEEAQTNENFRQAELKKAEEEMRGVLSDFRSRKVDPNRLYSKQRKVEIGNMIGGAFGALAASRLGVAGNTYADTARQNLAAIQAAIDRDIESQREEINKLGRVLGEKQNGLAMMRARFGDERQAEAALRIAQLDDVENQFKSKIAAAKIPGIEAEANQLLAGIQMQKAQAAIQLAGARNENALRTIAAKAKTGGANQGGKLLPAEVATKGGESQAALEALDKVAKSFKQKTNFASGVAKFIPGTDAAKYEDDVKVAAQVIGRLLEGGKLTDADYPRYLAMLPSPGDGAARAKNKIEALKAMIRVKLRGEESALRRSGYNTAGLQLEPQMGPPVN